MKPSKIITDSLGFELTFSIAVGGIPGRGQHRTYEAAGEGVQSEAEHIITINPELGDEELAEVAAHEAYHLFFSVRHLIKVDEETEAEVFGQLVKHIYTTVKRGEKQSPEQITNVPGFIEALKTENRCLSARVNTLLARQQGTMETITAAAILLPGYVVCGRRHHELIHGLAQSGVKTPITGEQGFLTSKNRFVGRVEALTLATAAGQIKQKHGNPHELYSEDLW